MQRSSPSPNFRVAGLHRVTPQTESKGKPHLPGLVTCFVDLTQVVDCLLFKTRVDSGVASKADRLGNVREMGGGRLRHRSCIQRLRWW